MEWRDDMGTYDFMKDLILSQGNYWILNKSLVSTLGLEAAFLLTSFMEAEKMMSDPNGWFYQTQQKTEEITTLSRHKQDKAIKLLIERKILIQENRGIPMKRYFKINAKELSKQVYKEHQSSLLKIDKLDCEEVANLDVENQQPRLTETNKLDCGKSATNKESNINNIDKENKINSSNSGGGGTEPLTDEVRNLIINEWNSLNISQLQAINRNTNRYKLLNARIKEYSIEGVVKAIQRIESSDFLKGNNNRGWMITFDWLLRPNNFIKVIEGNYDNKVKEKSESDNRQVENIETNNYKENTLPEFRIPGI